MDYFPSLEENIKSYRQLGIWDFLLHVRKLGLESNKPQLLEQHLGRLLGCELKLVASFNPDGFIEPKISVTDSEFLDPGRDVSEDELWLL